MLPPPFALSRVEEQSSTSTPEQIVKDYPLTSSGQGKEGPVRQSQINQILKCEELYEF